ncbi:MAG: restriction endonuclease, partial [Anaerolineae bacterium]
LTALAQWAAERLDKGLPLSDALHATTRYDALLNLFRRIDQGDPSLGIPRYNGGLFSPAGPENQFLESHRLSDRVVARAVDTLARDAGVPVDYAYISVRNLGAIYEGLLEYRLRVVDAAAGKVELVTDRGERKATGSYYTPDYIVNYIVQHTLGPILDERAPVFRTAMDRCADLRRRLERTSDPSTIRLLREQLDEAEREAREAFLSIKVCDPAMGSGHFLVNAVDFLTDGIIQRMQAYHDDHPDVPWEWNPIQRLVGRVREEILEEMARQGVEVDRARLDDTAILTRLVMKRCIYGVDLNRMA